MNLCVIESITFILKESLQRCNSTSDSKYLKILSEWVNYERQSSSNNVSLPQYIKYIHKFRDVLVGYQQQDIQQWVPGQFVSVYSSLKPIITTDASHFCLQYSRTGICSFCRALLNANRCEYSLLLSQNHVLKQGLGFAVLQYQESLEDYVCVE